MDDSLKKLLIILITFILSFAVCITLFIVFKKNFCGKTKEIYKPPDNSGNSNDNSDNSNDNSGELSDVFIRGICLDTTTVNTPNTPISDIWDKIKKWPLTSLPINSVRTYSFSGELKWIQYLLSQKVEVFIGISKNDSITGMCNTLKSWDPNMLTKIIAFSVANEPTTNREAKDTKGNTLVTVTDDYNSMKNKAVQLRTCLKTVYTNGLQPPPITACFVADTFSKIPEYMSLFKSNVLDPLVCSNIYSDLFSSNTNKPMTETALENSVSWSKGHTIVGQINNNYTLIKNNKLNAKLWITEIGWTSAPLASFAKGQGWASIDVEKKMYQNFLNASTDQGIIWPERIFWFTIRDTRTSVKNESFGLFDENFKSKFGDSPPPPPPPPPPPSSTGGYGTNENPFKDGCAKGAYCNNGGTLCFNNNDFYCQPNCSNITKPNCDKYPPPAKCQPFCPPPPTPSVDGYKDGEDIFQQNCSKGKKCANPKSNICFNKKLQKFSCEPSCSTSITPDCVHNAPKNPTCRSVFCPNTQSEYMATLPSNKEVYLYTDNYFNTVRSTNVSLNTIQRYLNSIKITDQIASYQMLTDAVQNGFSIDDDLWAWASDGNYYRYNLESSSPYYLDTYTYSSGGDFAAGVFLYGVKPESPPYNCQNIVYNKLGACIYPWAYMNRYSLLNPPQPKPLQPHPPHPEVYYTERQDGILFDYPAVQKLEVNLDKGTTIATTDQITSQLQMYRMNQSFYYPYKNGWASDGNLYKTDAKTLTLSTRNPKIGGIFLYGIKPAEGYVDTNTKLTPFPFSYKYMWSKYQ
jgi:hypothetical protein